ncbi:hypothetical protein ACFU98_43215, partial [Streptomyces sp. NPDC057575]|uniref:hypothetical protein n=1 Tax=Streptomyces sp. NPDC057575 TaxID=3346170 RepID=UPI003698434F
MREDDFDPMTDRPGRGCIHGDTKVSSVWKSRLVVEGVSQKSVMGEGDTSGAFRTLWSGGWV